MQIDGSVVHQLLVQSFGDVICDKAIYRVLVDYPILYDVEADMSGHTVLVPEHELPHEGLRLTESICLCLSSVSAASAHSAGFPVIHIADRVRFPALYNYLQQVFVRFERLDAQLHAYVDTHSNAQALLDACAQTTDCSLSLMDERYRGVSEAIGKSKANINVKRQPSGFGMLEEEGVDLFMASRNYRHMRLNKNVFAAPGSNDLLMKNLFVGGELKGVLMSYHEGSALSARYVRFVLNYLSGFLEQLYAHMGSFGIIPTESDRIRAALTSMLSGDQEDRTNIQRLLLDNGHSPESRYVVLSIKRSFTHEGPEGLDYLAHRFERAWPFAYCFTVDSALFMLADVDPRADSNDRDFLKDILITARDCLSKVGISRTFTSMEQLDTARLQASTALQQGATSDPTFWFYRFSDYALAWLIEQGWSSLPTESLAHPAVLELKRYDTEHDTELLHTLDTFIRCRFNATKAASELFVARSTLLNRLERIVEMTGVNLEDSDEILYIKLTLMHNA